ncbi:MAG: rhombosortase [Pseudomonadota bacterium]
MNWFKPLNAFLRNNAPALALMALCAVAQLGPIAEWLVYDRQLVDDGQYWRWLSANFTHLGWAHYAMNMGALGLMWLMFGRRYATVEWLFIVLFASLIVGLGVEHFLPNMHWYVGLSGSLHGIILAGSWREWRHDRLFAGVVATLTLTKLGYELVVGPMPGSEITAGGHVIVEAHAYGAAGGLVAAWLCDGLRRLWSGRQGH